VEYDATLGVAGSAVSGVAGAVSLGDAGEPAHGAVVMPRRAAEAVPVPAGTAPATIATAETTRAGTLEALRDVIGDCQRCNLASHRTKIVFGVGNPQAELVFVGEGPGRDEDEQGEPFVGRAGRLLTEIITKGMRLTREDVYIANVVKCRPPENRNPEPDEVASCEPFLLRQLDLIRPRVIVALGKFAVQTLLRTKAPISRLRGQWHDYHGIKLMPTFHPAYLLRNPAEKRVVWEDIKQVMGELGIPVKP
jgi:DNA polymerase